MVLRMLLLIVLLFTWIDATFAQEEETAGSKLLAPNIGLSEKHRIGKYWLLRVDVETKEAIFFLERAAEEDPLYRDTLTLLGRAYYRQGRYGDAIKILSRALLVNKEDEIGWLVLGLAQIRLDEDQKGLDSIKGGLVFLYKVSKSGYRGLPDWDSGGLVRRAIRRAILVVKRAGLGAKEEVIQSVENLLSRIDQEELAHQDWTVYKKPDDGFSISLPPSWVQMEWSPGGFLDATLQILKELDPEMARTLKWQQQRPANTVFSALDLPAKPEAFSVIGITKHDLSVALTLDDYVKVALLAYEKTKLIEKPISKRRVTLAGSDAVLLQYRMARTMNTGQATTLAITQYIVVKGRIVSQLVLGCTVGQAEKYAPIFEKVTHSFQWAE